MQPAFHYIVRVKLVRFVQDNKIDFINDEIIFIEENPIIAREKAIDYYEGYIDTLLEPNLSHQEIKNKLSDKILIGNDWLESYFNGIGVIMKIDKPIDNDVIGDENIIHGFGFGLSGTPQGLMDSLNTEMEYYKHHNYDTKNCSINVNFYEAEEDEVFEETILKTPFDWTGFDKPNKDAVVNDDLENEQNINFNSLTNYIENGEGNQIEFKSSLVSYKNEKNIGYSRHIRFKIIKAIVSFLNSNGGLLYIGVKDDKSILGLDSDFSLAQSKIDNPKDYFRLEVDKIIMQNFKSVATFIKGEFIEIEDKIIYIFIVEPSPRPIFILNNTDSDSNNHKKEFYVRLTGASSVLYSESEEIVEYCLNHWSK